MAWTTLEVPDKFITWNDTTLLEAKRVGTFWGGEGFTLTIKHYTKEKIMKDKK
jgi:hypothetical protein